MQIQPIQLSRRRLLTLAGLSAGATVLTRRPLFAEDEGIVPTMINAAAKAKITIRHVRRNISVLEGSGGNIAVSPGKTASYSVDAGFVCLAASDRRCIGIDQCRARSSIWSILHWHTDHTDGNGWLHSAGAAITAHENFRKRLRWIPAWRDGVGHSRQLPPALFRPLNLHPAIMRRKTRRLALKYYGAGPHGQRHLRPLHREPM